MRKHLNIYYLLETALTAFSQASFAIVFLIWCWWKLSSNFCSAGWKNYSWPFILQPLIKISGFSNRKLLRSLPNFLFLGCSCIWRSVLNHQESRSQVNWLCFVPRADGGFLDLLRRGPSMVLTLSRKLAFLSWVVSAAWIYCFCCYWNSPCCYCSPVA